MREKRAAAADGDVVDAFNRYVNMTPKSLESWLRTDESKTVGQNRTQGAESTGHRSGRNIIELMRKRADAYDDHDRVEMHRVVGYIKRHLAQRPHRDDVAHTRWTYSLKNWGQDPSRDER